MLKNEHTGLMKVAERGCNTIEGMNAELTEVCTETHREGVAMAARSVAAHMYTQIQQSRCLLIFD